MEFFRIGFVRFGLIDLIDVSIVAFLFYRFLLLVKGTRAVQILSGLFLLFLISFGAFWFEMEGMKWLITNIATVGILVLVIVFQPEIRGALAQIGHPGILRRFFKLEKSETLDEIVEATKKLSELKYGALIVLEKNIGLKDYVFSGRSLNATVSSDFLVTLFTPYTPLHDGAVIIRGDMVVAAACTLPLTTKPEYSQLFGMRHKAAIGITEESDAIAIAVSEETGDISMAYQGKLQKLPDPSLLKETLSKLLGR